MGSDIARERARSGLVYVVEGAEPDGQAFYEASWYAVEVEEFRRASAVEVTVGDIWEEPSGHAVRETSSKSFSEPPFTSGKIFAGTWRERFDRVLDDAAARRTDIDSLRVAFEKHGLFAGEDELGSGAACAHELLALFDYTSRRDAVAFLLARYDAERIASISVMQHDGVVLFD